MRASSLLLALALQISLSSAWPWPPTLENLNIALGRRNMDTVLDKNDIDLRAAATTAAAASTTGEAAASTAAASSGATADSGTAKETGSASASASGSAAATSGNKTASSGDPKITAAKSIPVNAAAGGFSMMTPAQTSATYGKIGYPITFVWNYTSLLAPPSAVDVIASNTDGVWTITSNMSVQQTGSVVWNTSNEATPLPMESYTFVIYDAKVGPTAVPSPGHLSPYLGYGFAMYSPQAAVNSSDYYCVTCNSAISSAERQSLYVLMGTCIITILSFTYFSCGFLGVF